MTAVSNPNSNPPSAPTTVPLTTYELMLMQSPWQQLPKLYPEAPAGYTLSSAGGGRDAGRTLPHPVAAVQLQANPLNVPEVHIGDNSHRLAPASPPSSALSHHTNAPALLMPGTSLPSPPVRAQLASCLRHKQCSRDWPGAEP